MVTYHTANVDGLDVFYREAGQPEKPTMLLLHGFPTASHLFRNLMPLLEDSYHLIAPDLIGFGMSAAPARSEFTYTFEALTDVVDKLLTTLDITDFYLYVFDYGAPVGFRLALRHPEHILGIVSQNGNAHEEGLGAKWEARKRYWENPTPKMREQLKQAFAPQTVRGQYTFGEAEGSVAPDGWQLDLWYAAQGGEEYAERQSDLIFDYQTNVALYPAFQEYLRTWQPPLLAAWGRNDPSFIWQGAVAFKRDVPNATVSLLDGGHFVLETHYEEIARLIRVTFGEKDSKRHEGELPRTA